MPEINQVTVKGTTYDIVDSGATRQSFVGDTPMGTSATTVTGAIAEHSTDLTQRVKTINGRSPDPITGDIVVIEGGGSSSYGAYRVDAIINTSDWTLTNGLYRANITNTTLADIITASMDGSETWLDDESVMLGDTTFTTYNGGIYVDTSILPTSAWHLHILLAMNGAEVISDLTAKIESEVSHAESGVAILANGNTAPKAIAKGQYIYIKNHLTLAEGMYTATSAIGNGDPLTTSNTTLCSNGGLNNVQTDLATLNSNLNGLKVEKGNIDSGASVTINSTRIALVLVGRAGASIYATVAFIDQWGGIVYISNNTDFVVSISNGNATITNNASAYTNYLVLYTS